MKLAISGFLFSRIKHRVGMPEEIDLREHLLHGSLPSSEALCLSLAWRRPLLLHKALYCRRCCRCLSSKLKDCVAVDIQGQEVCTFKSIQAHVFHALPKFVPGGSREQGHERQPRAVGACTVSSLQRCCLHCQGTIMPASTGMPAMVQESGCSWNTPCLQSSPGEPITREGHHVSSAGMLGGCRI